MDIEIFRNYCLAKKGVTEDLPFDENTLAFKVLGKVFALTGLNKTPFSVNLKCDPDRAIALREEHEEVQAGYHMSKKHWNTVNFEGNLPDELLKDLINHSYDLVVSKLKKAEREGLNL